LNPMPQINSDSQAAIQPELASGESILWTGMPSSSVIFHKEDALLIPFSLLWGGFGIFWEAAAAGLLGAAQRAQGVSVFAMVWGGAFVLIGQYLIWGRFIYSAWKKLRTHYAVTDRRVIVVQDGFSRKAISAFIDTLPTITKEEGQGGFGTLRFANTDSMWSGRQGWGIWDRMSLGSVPTFVDIENVNAVYRLTSEQRAKSRTAKAAY